MNIGRGRQRGPPPHYMLYGYPVPHPSDLDIDSIRKVFPRPGIGRGHPRRHDTSRSLPELSSTPPRIPWGPDSTQTTVTTAVRGRGRGPLLRTHTSSNNSLANAQNRSSDQRLPQQRKLSVTQSTTIQSPPSESRLLSCVSDEALYKNLTQQTTCRRFPTNRRQEDATRRTGFSEPMERAEAILRKDPGEDAFYNYDDDSN